MLAVTAPHPARDPELLPGEIVGGKYCVERVLGRGGMGVVLEARNLLLDERVAIKLLAGVATPALEKRLLGEARAMARLRSDHVVRVFDVGQLASGAPYVVMELLVGLPLSAVRQRWGTPSVPDVVGWMLDACAGLAVAHRHGIVHRDLKPANLFLEQRQDARARVKVIDFGIAKLPERDAVITTAGPIGSPIYMSPEQLSNAPDIDARTDIWGLGVVLYELLAGRTPFPSCSLLELAVRLRDQRQASLHELRPDVPVELARVVDRCLEKQREARWGSAAELALALAPFRATPPASSVSSLDGLAWSVEPQRPLEPRPPLALPSIEPAPGELPPTFEPQQPLEPMYSEREAHSGLALAQTQTPAATLAPAARASDDAALGLFGARFGFFRARAQPVPRSASRRMSWRWMVAAFVLGHAPTPAAWAPQAASGAAASSAAGAPSEPASGASPSNAGSSRSNIALSVAASSGDGRVSPAPIRPVPDALEVLHGESRGVGAGARATEPTAPATVLRENVALAMAATVEPAVPVRAPLGPATLGLLTPAAPARTIRASASSASTPRAPAVNTSAARAGAPAEAQPHREAQPNRKPQPRREVQPRREPPSEPARAQPGATVDTPAGPLPIDRTLAW